MITGDLGLFGERLAVALGFVTLVLFIGTGLTCRSFVPLADRLNITWFTGSRPYKAIFRYHSFFWYGFFVVLFLHMLIGFMHTEFPQAGDPDAVQHLWILVFAVSLFISVGLTFSNCRTFMGFLRIFKGDSLLAGFYGRFYRLHSYVWVLLLVALVGHLIASYIHIGFWPTEIE